MPSIHLIHKHHKEHQQPRLALPRSSSGGATVVKGDEDDSNCSISSTLTVEASIGDKQEEASKSLLISIDRKHEEENLLDILSTSPRHVRFEDTPIVLGDAVSMDFTCSCWYSHDDYHRIRKSLGVDVTDVATSREKTADRFRTALVHTYSACYSVPAACEITSGSTRHHHKKKEMSSFIAPEDKFDIVACYVKQPNRLGLERLSSEVLLHETNQKRKMVVRNVLRAQKVTHGDTVAIEQSVSPLTRSSQLFAHILAKALHASAKK